MLARVGNCVGQSSMPLCRTVSVYTCCLVSLFHSQRYPNLETTCYMLMLSVYLANLRRCAVFPLVTPEKTNWKSTKPQ